MIASFSAFGGDLPSIALIALNILEGYVLWSSVSTNCLHVFLRCSFVVLVISSFICCRAGELGSLDLRSSRALILSNNSAGTGSVLILYRPDGICFDAVFRIMVRKIFSFWQFVGSRLLLSLSSIPLRYRSQFAFFKLKLVRWGMGIVSRVVPNTIFESYIRIVSILLQYHQDTSANRQPPRGVTLAIPSYTFDTLHNTICFQEFHG